MAQWSCVEPDQAFVLSEATASCRGNTHSAVPFSGCLPWRAAQILQPDPWQGSLTSIPAAVLSPFASACMLFPAVPAGPMPFSSPWKHQLAALSIASWAAPIHTPFRVHFFWPHATRRRLLRDPRCHGREAGLEWSAPARKAKNNQDHQKINQVYSSPSQQPQLSITSPDTIAAASASIASPDAMTAASASSTSPEAIARELSTAAALRCGC